MSCRFFVVILLLKSITNNNSNKFMSESKEPIRLRQRKMATGNISLYLDIYIDGKRTYEYLKMYLIPDGKAMRL